MIAQTIADYLAFAEQLAVRAKDISLPNFRHPLPVEVKDDASPVTEIDRATERVVREEIERHYPAHGIIGEEFGAIAADASHVWVIDPIDGTRSFISGSPLYCTLIALLIDGVPVVGVIDLPALGERWSGASNMAFSQARFNGEDCRVVAAASLSAAVLATTTLVGDDEDDSERRLRRLVRRAGQLRLGGDASAYGCVASGFCHLAADYQMQAYDYLALVPIIHAAGGVITDWRGETLRLTAGKIGVVAAGGPALHRQALAVLNE